MKEYLLYLAVMSLAADLVILCACLIPGRFSGRDRIWMEKDPVGGRGGTPADPGPDDQFHGAGFFCSLSYPDRGKRDRILFTIRGRNIEGVPEAEISDTEDAVQPGQEAQLDDTLRSEACDSVG